MAVRRLGGLALGVLSLVVVGAGLAWACTPQAQLHVVGPNQTRAGGWVTVRGTSYPDGDAVRIRWEGPKGELLATVYLPDQTDDFTKSVRVPSTAKPGARVIIGVPAKGVRAFGSNQTTAGRAAIGVVAPRPSGGNPPVGRPDRPGDGRPDRPGDGRPDRPGDGRPDRPDRGRGATSPGARDIRGRPGRGERNRPGRSRSGNPSPGARDIGARGDRVPAVSIPEVSIPEGSSGAGPEVFPGSQAPGASGTEPSPSPGTAPGATAPGDRQSSSGQNAWTARRAGEAPSLTPDRDDEEAATDPGMSPGLAIGAGLLGFGLVALFAGFAVAEVRRRRLAGHPGHWTPE